MEEVIFSEITAKVAIDFLTVISTTIDQYENIFLDIERKSGAVCVQESPDGAWFLRGDLDSINRAYNLMSTIYNLSQLDFMSSEVRSGAPGTPLFCQSSECTDVVRYAANTPVVPSLKDDADDYRSSDDTSVVDRPQNDELTVTTENENALDQERPSYGISNVEHSFSIPVLPSSLDDAKKNRRKKGLPRKAVVSRGPRKVTLLLSAKDLSCEKKILRPRKLVPLKNVEETNVLSKESQKTCRSKKRKDAKKKCYIEDVIKKLNNSKINSGNMGKPLRKFGHVDTGKIFIKPFEGGLTGGCISDLHCGSKLICKNCGKFFSSQSNLYRHQKVSHHGMRFQCATCSKEFTCRISLRRHEQIVHDGLRCEVCLRIFASESQKTQHNCPGRRQEESVTCEVCGKLFSCISNLNKHMRIRHLGKTHICKLCSTHFISAVDLADHSRLVHCACSKCGKSFLSENYVNEHEAAGSCSVRTVRVKEKSVVDGVGKQESRKPKVCEFCHKVFSSSSNVRKHIRVVHNNVRYDCSICSRAYACKEQLLQHLTKVHQGLTYKCSICKEEFRNRLRLAKHQKLIHNHLADESSFQCELCGKTFLYKNNLQRHIKVDHEGLSYACGICTQSFKSMQQAKEHDLVMHQGKTISCQLCSKVFSSHYKLREHETSVHTDLRPHQCAVCGEAFGRHSLLSYHLQKKHNRRVNVAGELLPLPDPEIAFKPMLDIQESLLSEAEPTGAVATETGPDFRSCCEPESNERAQASNYTAVSSVTTQSNPVLISPNANKSSWNTEIESSLDKSSNESTRDLVSADDLGQLQGFHQVPSVPPPQGAVQGCTDAPVLYSHSVDIHNSQDPLLALPDAFPFFDNFSYSPPLHGSLEQRHNQDLSFFHPSNSTY